MPSSFSQLALRCSPILMAIIVSGLVLIFSGSGQLPLLLPLWALAAYSTARAGKTVSLRELMLLQIMLSLLIIGMIWGPWQSNPHLNRIAHALTAAAIVILLCAEMKKQGNHLLVAAAAVAIALSLGILMEVAEAIASPSSADGVARWHDTLKDLLADLGGSWAGAALWLSWPALKHTLAFRQQA